MNTIATKITRFLIAYRLLQVVIYRYWYNQYIQFIFFLNLLKQDRCRLRGLAIDNADNIFESEPHYGDYSKIAKNIDNTYTLTKTNLTVFSFDTAGKLTQIEDRNDNQTTLTYTSGKLTKVTDPYGRETTLQYTGRDCPKFS